MTVAPHSPADCQVEATSQETTAVQQLPQPDSSIDTGEDVRSSPSPSPPPPSPPPQPPVLPALTIPSISIPSQPPKSPQRPTPSTASASDATQPPKSHSPPAFSSPVTRPRSSEPIAGTSPLTPINPDTSLSDPGQDSFHGDETEDSKANILKLVVDSRLSPTSIDSTPTPSPTISPATLAESTQQNVPFIPDFASNGPRTSATPGLQYDRVPSDALFVGSAIPVEALVSE